jgi:uncharacterized protein YhfF
MNTTTNAAIESFWARFIHAHPSMAHARFTEAEQYGAGVEMGNELCALILAGTKTATCSCLWEWQAEGEPIPQAGELSVLLDGHGVPRAVLETIEVSVRRYDEVDAAFASQEGEDDRTLESWRRIHWKWFSDGLPAIGRAPSMDMPLVCERFRVRYAE